MNMSKLRSLLTLLIIGGLLFFSSCDEGGEVEIPQKTGVLIVNEGNFGAGNGSLSFYDEELMTITNNVVKNANDGAEIGSIIQSIYLHDDVGYLLCNDANKIEFIDQDNFKFLANPTDEVNVPRYMAVVGDMGYISCWGPYDANYGLSDSYIAVMDLGAKAIVDTLDCGSGPEGIIALNNKLYVANSFETSVSVIDLNDKSSAKINFDAAPQHFVPDALGNIWVSLASGWQYPADKAGIQAIDISSNSKGAFVAIPNLKGNIAINASGEKIYAIAIEPWDANKPNQASEIQVYNTLTKSLGTNPIISGDNFYGLGYNVTTDKIYVTDNQAFAGNGKIMVYDTDGMLLDEQVSGIGPNGFALK